MDNNIPLADSVVFNEECLTLDIYDDSNRKLYDIDLERCRNASELLDWILQINCKSWASPGIIKSILNTIEDTCSNIFESNAQGVFCPFGRLTEVDWKNKEWKQIG